MEKIIMRHADVIREIHGKLRPNEFKSKYKIIVAPNSANRYHILLQDILSREQFYFSNSSHTENCEEVYKRYCKSEN